MAGLSVRVEVSALDLHRVRELLAAALDMAGVVGELVDAGDAPTHLEAAYEAWATTLDDYRADRA